MANQVTVDQDKYSSPVPVIGMYVAGASLVCLLLIILDVFHGFHSRKKWLPCRWFSLNSVSLTLLSIAAKLPVDLTTSMPDAQSQLSKLTGTAFICICMGFFMPSVGSNRTSESWTNMISLTIFVVTVIVNISIQLSTGLIFMFIPEHVIIMCFMLILLSILWLSTWGINLMKETQSDLNKNIFTEGLGSPTLLERLKLCYLQGYNCDPQFLLCESIFSLHATAVSFFCLIVVLQAIVYSYSKGYHMVYINGVESDYGWSMTIIVVSQMSVILLVCLVTCFRALFMSDVIDSKVIKTPFATLSEIPLNFPFLKGDVRCYLDFFIISIPVLYVAGIGAMALALPGIMLLLIYLLVDSTIEFFGLYKREQKDPEGMQHYKNVLEENKVEMKEGTLRKCVEDMNDLMCVSENRSNSMSELRELLLKAKADPSRRSHIISQIKSKKGNEVYSLYLVYLVKVASVSIPSSLNVHLSQWLNEVFDAIQFVDTKLYSSSFENKRKLTLAKALWMGVDFSNFARLKLPPGLEIIRRLKEVLPLRFISGKVHVILDFLNDRGQNCATIEEFNDHVEELFVSMLYELLSQLPHAIIKEVSESPVEEYEESVRRVLKLLGQIQSFDGTVEWSFPENSNFSNIIPNVTEDEGKMVNNVPSDEIFQV